MDRRGTPPVVCQLHGFFTEYLASGFAGGLSERGMAYQRSYLNQASAARLGKFDLFPDTGVAGLSVNI